MQQEICRVPRCPCLVGILLLLAPQSEVTATDEHMGGMGAPIGQREGGGFADAAVAPVDQGRGTCEVVALMRSLFWIF